MYLALGDSDDPVVDWISTRLSMSFRAAPARVSVILTDGYEPVATVGESTAFSCLYRAIRVPKRTTTADETYFEAEWFCRDMNLLQLARGANIRPSAGRLLSDAELLHRLPKSLRVAECIFLDYPPPAPTVCSDQWQDLSTGETGIGCPSEKNSGLVRVFADASLEYTFFLTCWHDVFPLSWNESFTGAQERELAQNAATVLSANGAHHAGLVLTKTSLGSRVARVVQFPPVEWYNAVNSPYPFIACLRRMFSLERDLSTQ